MGHHANPRLTAALAGILVLAPVPAGADGETTLPPVPDLDVAWETIGVPATLQALPAAAAPAGKVTFALTSPEAGLILPPRALVGWAIAVKVSGPNNGLALFSVNLRQDAANPELFHLPPGDAAPPAMSAFDRPLGFTNPRADPYGSGYGGLPRALTGEHRDLLQIGGAQNTFGGGGACLEPGADVCLGQAMEVRPLVGRRAPVQVASGRFPLPATPGLYTFHLDGARANVLAGTKESTGGVRPARVEIGEAWFSVRVAGSEPTVEATVAMERPPAGPTTPVTDAVVRPAEGAALPYTHVPFRWPPLAGGAAGYRLQVVEDDGSSDPFAAPGAHVLEAVAPGPEPRHVVTDGLSFSNAYAWRVAAQGAGPGILAAAPVHRFRTLPLPAFSFDLEAAHPEPGPVQPGVTLFNVARRRDPPETSGSLALAVNEAGEPVFFTYRPGEGNIGYIEVRETGRLLMLRAEEADTGDPADDAVSKVIDETLDGRIAWQSPDDRDYEPHHDADLMPDGNVILLLHDRLHLPGDGGQERVGDRIVVLDRHTKEEIWSWRAIDHYSILDGRFPDWTHGNTARYHAPDNSIYFSARHFSRITRIDFDTGRIVYNMGAATPSGDTDFGDGFFTYQHSPEILPNGNMVLFDNGNRSTPRVSRAIEIRFNSNTMPTGAEIVWAGYPVNDLGQPFLSRFAGDADRLPSGNTIMNSAPRATIYEITRDGRLVWKLRVGRGFPDTSIYRIQKLPGLHRDTPGDRDGDQDVDLLDLAGLQAGAGAGGLGFPDRLSDFDGDDDLDADDAAGLARWMTGPLEGD